MRKNATHIENSRPLISIIVSSYFFIDLQRSFENKVVFDDEEVVRRLLSKQLQPCVPS